MRRIALAIGAGLVLAACGGTSSAAPTPTPAALTPATIKVSLPGLKPAFSQADIAVAQANGFFAQEKLTVQTQGLASGVQTVQSVIAGDSDIGASSIEPVMSAAVKGGLTVIGSYADRLPVVIESPDGIANAAGLKGKQLGIQSVGAFREIMLREEYSAAGLSQDDVNYVTVADTGYVSALLTHKIDAAVLQQEQSIDVEAKDPGFHVIADMFKLQPNYYYGTFFVKSDWLQANRGVAVRFLTALTRAHRLIYSNRAEVVPEIADTTGFPVDEVQKAYDKLVVQNGVFPVNQGLQASRLTYTLGVMKQFNLLPNGSPDLSTVIDRGPINDAVNSLGGPMKGDPRWH